MAFEKFEKGSYRGTSEPKITLRQSGGIGITKVALEEYFENYDGVVLYYDEDENRIGLEPADTDEDPNAYSLNKTQGSGSVPAKSFTRRYDLVPEETTQYDPTWDDENGIIVVDLDQTSE